MDEQPKCGLCEGKGKLPHPDYSVQWEIDCPDCIARKKDAEIKKLREALKPFAKQGELSKLLPPILLPPMHLCSLAASAMREGYSKRFEAAFHASAPIVVDTEKELAWRWWHARGESDLAAERERCCEEIRDNCTQCGGSGGHQEQRRYVTPDMASDACEPDMAGMVIEGDVSECEYCGRPIAVVRAMGDPT